MAQLSIKQAIKQSVEMMQIQADIDHEKIESARAELETALNNVDEKTTVKFGDVANGFGDDLIQDYKLDTDSTVDLTTFTTATPLNLNTATQLSIELGKLQAKKDHKVISELIDAQASNAAITDAELLSMFDVDVRVAYKQKYAPETFNFNTDPDMLLYLLNQNDLYEDYSSSVDGNIITISNGTDSVDFTVDENGATASSTQYVVTYKSGEVADA